MISNVVNQAFMDIKLSTLARGIITHSFKSVPDEIIVESMEKCKAKGLSTLLVPFKCPPLCQLFGSASGQQGHTFPTTPEIAAILNNKGFKDLEQEMEKYGLYVSALLIVKDHAEMAISNTPPAVPLRKCAEIRLG